MNKLLRALLKHQAVTLEADGCIVPARKDKRKRRLAQGKRDKQLPLWGKP